MVCMYMYMNTHIYTHAHNEILLSHTNNVLCHLQQTYTYIWKGIMLSELC